ncbi:MAG TPA: hypothetical protein VK890_00495 [Bacteroidia bacterium]|nr:hypothetical protein [Bacteroidia bacterium]
MGFIQDIKIKAGEYFLRKESASGKRSHAIMNIRDAKTIGVIFNAGDIKEVELVKKYISYLREMGKKVRSMGYVALKELPGNITTSIDHQCFTLKNVNWYYKPAISFIGSFVTEEYDLLLDLNIATQLPLIYVATLSKAKCKVGRYSEKYMSLYDVMIETDDQKTLKYFLQNVDTYMEMLNKKAV